MGKRSRRIGVSIALIAFLTGAVANALLLFQWAAIHSLNVDDNAYWVHQYKTSQGDSQLTSVSVLVARRPYTEEVLSILQQAMYAEDCRVRILAMVALAEEGAFCREIAEISVEDSDRRVREVAASLIRCESDHDSVHRCDDDN